MQGGLRYEAVYDDIRITWMWYGIAGVISGRATDPEPYFTGGKRLKLSPTAAAVTKAMKEMTDTLTEAEKKAADLGFQIGQDVEQQLAAGSEAVKRTRETLQQVAAPLQLDTTDKTMLYGAGSALGSMLLYHAYEHYHSLQRLHPTMSRRMLLRQVLRGAFSRAQRAAQGRDGAFMQVFALVGPLLLMLSGGQYVYKHREKVYDKAQNWLKTKGRSTDTRE